MVDIFSEFRLLDLSVCEYVVVLCNMGYHVLGFMDFGDWVIRSALPLYNLVILFYCNYLHQCCGSGPEPDSYVFGPPGFVSHRHDSGSFHQAKIIRETFIPTVL
jgi:hypothetical protein